MAERYALWFGNLSHNSASSVGEHAVLYSKAFTILQPEPEAPVVHAFDDDFSQAVLFEADFSQANFHPPVTSADTEPVDFDSTPTMTDSGDTVVSEAKPATKDSEDITEEKATTAEFKVPPIPDVKSKVRN